MHLLTIAFAAVGLLLFLILVLKLHAFLALLISSLAMGLAAGMTPAAVLKSVQTGFGEALGFIAVVVGLGAMIGAFLEHSGGGRALADWLIEKFGRDNAAWAVLLAGFIVGLPIFFEVGFMILVPLAYSLTRESNLLNPTRPKSLLFYGLAMLAPLTVLHALVPPHPAPAAAAKLLGADLGSAIIYGALLSIPMAIIGGIVYGHWISKRVFVPVPANAPLPETTSGIKPPAPLATALLLLLTVTLILIGTIWDKSYIFALIGHPFGALLVTLIAAMVMFGSMRGLSREQITNLATKSLLPVGSLLVIMGGGGAFKQIIVDSGAGKLAGEMLAQTNISPLLVAYLMAAAMRVAQGSATVAIITAAGLMAPLTKSIVNYNPTMVYLALCCGGTLLSHVNDAGFWIVNQYFGMTVPQTLKSWTAMKMITSIVGLAILLTINAFL